MEGKIDLLIKSVNEIKSTQSKLVTSVNSLSDKFASLNKKVNELSSQISSLSSDNASLKERVDIIEIKTNSLSTNPSILNNNELISEMMDRQSRLKNILLFNLPESYHDPNSMNLDLTTVQNILNFLNVESKPSSIFRLGKPPSTSTATKPRPLKICFYDQKSVLDIFSTQNKLKSNSLWKDLRFSSDRTKQQQEYMSQLRKDLLTRKSNGEPDLIIKYIKGTPTIISSKN